MKVKRRGGMTELIPTPKEKREALIRDNVLDLLDNLDKRIRRIEGAFYIVEGGAEEFQRVIERMRAEEHQALRMNEKLRAEGESKSSESG